jgi:hypothetical protein
MLMLGEIEAGGNLEIGDSAISASGKNT